MQSDIAHKQMVVIGLIGSCPLGDPLDGCQLNQLRDLNLDSVQRYVHSLCEDGLDNIIACHDRCLAQREG